MDLHDLHCFEAIATLGNMSRAAEVLGRTQPALTKCVQRLESEVGSKLFHRQGRGLVLSESGAVLLASADRIRREAAEAKRHIADLSKGAAGLVRIGAGAPIIGQLLPEVLPEVLAQSPAATFQVTMGAAAALAHALRQGELDLWIGAASRPPDPALAWQALWEEQSVIVARHGHRLARRGLRLADLAGAGWALPPAGVESRRWLEEQLAGHGLPAPRIVIETNLAPAQPRLIAATDLLSIVSRRALRSPEVGTLLAALPLRGTMLTRPYGFYLRKDAYLSPAARKFIDVLTRHAREPLA